MHTILHVYSKPIVVHVFHLLQCYKTLSICKYSNVQFHLIHKHVKSPGLNDKYTCHKMCLDLQTNALQISSPFLPWFTVALPDKHSTQYKLVLDNMVTLEEVFLDIKLAD